MSPRPTTSRAACMTSFALRWYRCLAVAWFFLASLSLPAASTFKRAPCGWSVSFRAPPPASLHLSFRLEPAYFDDGLALVLHRPGAMGRCSCSRHGLRSQPTAPNHEAAWPRLRPACLPASGVRYTLPCASVCSWQLLPARQTTLSVGESSSCWCRACWFSERRDPVMCRLLSDRP